MSEKVIVLKKLDSGQLEMQFVFSGVGDDPVIRLDSKFSDPLTDIAEALLKFDALYGSDGSLSHDAKVIYAFWESGNCMYNCSFTPQLQRMVELELNICSDINAGIHVKEEFDARASFGLDKLLADLYDEMKKLLIRYGFCGYREQWNRPFPVALFIKLHDLTRHRQQLCNGFFSELDALRLIIESEQ